MELWKLALVMNVSSVCRKVTDTSGQVKTRSYYKAVQGCNLSIRITCSSVHVYKVRFI